MPYQCSYPGCFIATSSHYCRDHRRHCSECGLEWSDVDLVAGKCPECNRIDNRYYDGCESACCAPLDNRANVTVDGVSRFA